MQIELGESFSMGISRSSLVACALAFHCLGCIPASAPPTANAGPDQMVTLGDVVTLDGAGSAASDGGKLTYQWQFIVRPDASLSVLSGTGTATPQFQADKPGIFSLRLTVIDEAGNSAIDSVVITVQGMLATVPDLTGLTEAEAEAALAAAGLIKGDVTMGSSGTIPVGHVIQSDPGPGEEHLPGTPVDLVLSSGPAVVMVPDVTGLQRALAENILTNAGLQVGAVTFAHSETVLAGNVIETSPSADTEVDEGTDVDLLLSLGPASANQVAVPDVVGLDRASAEAALTSAGLMVGNVTFENSEVIEADAIILSDPAAATIVDSGATVDLVVSIGPSSGIQVEVPDLAGLTQSEAQTALTNVGLNLGSVLQRADGATEPGTVLDQSPTAGTFINEGAYVAITIAIAPISIQRSGTTDIRAALADPGPGNVLRPDAVAVDSARGEFFIAARYTTHVAVYDTVRAEIIRTLDTGFVLPGEKRVFVATGSESLYVFDSATSMLSAFQRDTGAEIASTPIAGEFLDLVLDIEQNRLYLARRESPGLLLLNASTLAEEGTSTRLDGVGGAMRLDENTTQLLVLNTSLDADDGELRTYDPAADSIVDTITFDMPGSGPSIARQLEYDADGSRFFVRGDESVGVYGMDGSNPRSLPLPSNHRSASMVYDPASDRLIVVSLAPQSVGAVVTHRGAFLLTYDPNIGQGTSPLNFRPLGEFNQHLALDTTNNTVLSPDHSTGTVWTLNTTPFPIEASVFELGVGIDQILLAGDHVIGTSRFRTSLLFQFVPGAPTITTFSAGTWPASAALTTGSGGAASLAVLNAWDSTVSLLSIEDNPNILDTLATGLPPGTTEQVPGLALSPDGSQIAVAYPEFASVSILDRSDGNVAATIQLPDFDNQGETNDVGQLQVLFDQGGAGYLFVFDRISRVLYRYDTANEFAPLSTEGLAGRFPDMMDAPPAGWLFQDVEANVLFVGPVRVNPDTGVASGDILPDTQVVRGIDPLFNLYWTLEQVGTPSGFATVLRSIDRTANSLAPAELPLPENHPISPEVAFDTRNRQFHIAYPETAVIEHYSY